MFEYNCRTDRQNCNKSTNVYMLDLVFFPHRIGMCFRHFECGFSVYICSNALYRSWNIIRICLFTPFYGSEFYTFALRLGIIVFELKQKRNKYPRAKSAWNWRINRFPHKMHRFYIFMFMFPWHIIHTVTDTKPTNKNNCLLKHLNPAKNEQTDRLKNKVPSTVRWHWRAARTKRSKIDWNIMFMKKWKLR